MSRFDWLEVPDENDDKLKDSDRSIETHSEYDARQYLQLAAREFNQGDYELSLRYYSRVLHLERDSTEAWVGQVKALIKLEELSEAKVWVEKALKMFPKQPGLLAAKALLMSRSALYEDALAYSDNSMRQADNSPYQWLVRGEIFLGLKKLELAQYCFDKAEEEDRDKAKVLFDVGEAYFFARLFVRASDYFRRSLECESAHYFRWFRLAKAYQNLHWPAKAKSCCQRALELKSDFMPAVYCLTDLDNNQGSGLAGFFNFLARLFRRENG